MRQKVRPHVAGQTGRQKGRNEAQAIRERKESKREKQHKAKDERESSKEREGKERSMNDEARRVLISLQTK